jgi:hypothetical protein
MWRDTSRQFDSTKYGLKLLDGGALVEISRDGITALVPVSSVDFMVLAADVHANLKGRAPVAIVEPTITVEVVHEAKKPAKKKA